MNDEEMAAKVTEATGEDPQDALRLVKAIRLVLATDIPLAPPPGEGVFVAEQLGPSANPEKQTRIDAIKAEIAAIRAMSDDAPAASEEK